MSFFDPRRLALPVLCAALVARTASAQPSSEPPNPPQATDPALGDARTALQAGRFEEALALFTRLYRARPSAETAAGLAECEAKLAKHRDAAEHFAAALSMLPINDTAEGPRLRELLKTEKVYVGTVVFQVEHGGVASVLVDGVARGSTPLKLPLYLDPGEHTFEAEADKRRFVGVSAQLAAGQTVTLTLREAPPPPPPPTPPRKPLWPGIVLASLATAGAAVGIGTLVVSFSREEDVEERAKSIESCDLDALDQACVDLASLLSDRNGLRNASTVAFIASGVALAATLGYVFIPLPVETVTKKALGIAPLAGPNQGGVVLLGAF